MAIFLVYSWIKSVQKCCDHSCSKINVFFDSYHRIYHPLLHLRMERLQMTLQRDYHMCGTYIHGGRGVDHSLWPLEWRIHLLSLAWKVNALVIPKGDWLGVLNDWCIIDTFNLHIPWIVKLNFPCSYYSYLVLIIGFMNVKLVWDMCMCQRLRCSCSHPYHPSNIQHKFLIVWNMIK